MALKLTMSCAEYDRSRPLIDGRVTARDIANADRVVATRSAVEKLQEALAS